MSNITAMSEARLKFKDNLSKIAFLGDIHLKSKETLGKTNNKGLPILLQNKLDSIKYFVDYVMADENIEIVILLGDIFHKVNPPQWLRDLFLEIIKPLIYNDGITIYFILGNHDTNWISSNLQKEIEIFGGGYNIHYITEPVVKEFEGVHLCLAPYRANLSDLPTADVLVTHNGIEGGVVGYYDKPLNDVDYTHEGIRSKGYRVVIAGHYHKPQIFFIKRTECWYAGTTTIVDFSERGEEKGFLLMDSNMVVEAIHFPEYTQFTEIELIEPSDPYEIINSQYPDIEGHIVKLKFIGTSLWFSTINHLALFNWLVSDRKVQDYVIATDFSDVETVETVETENKTNGEILDEYIEANESISDDLADVGKEIFQSIIKEE